MQIFFQTKKIDLHPHEENHMARRVEGMRKFFTEYAQAFVDVEKTRADHNGQDLYYVSIKIEDAPYQYFVDEYQSDPRKAFDNAYQDIYRIVRNDRSRSRTMLKEAGRKFKNLFRRKYK